MVLRFFSFCGVISLLASPVVAQFGVGNKKRGTNFQDLNELAQEQHQGKGGAMGMGMGMNGMPSMEDLAKMMDPAEMDEIIRQAMEDPEMMEMMKGFGDMDLSSAMKELANLTPEQLAQQMQEAMALFTSEDYLDTALQSQDEILKNLEASGMVSDEDLEAFRANPQKLEEEMKAAMNQLKELFNDPEAMDTATQIAQGLSDMLTDPEKMMAAMAELTDSLSDDDKIEEARLQLLANPEMAGSADLAELFGSSEMKDILNDPIAWRESVKKGKNMMFGGADGAKAEL